jgi:hypothetical protein
VAESPSDGAELQFERAEFAEPTELSCTFCKVPIGDAYFDVNGHVTCATCRDRLRAVHGAGVDVRRLGGAALLGLVAAVVGSAVWYAVRVLTHLEIGLIAIGIGLAVGTAVRRGARGRGGLPYQVLAVALTYLAIASANIPWVMAGIREGLARGIAQRMEAAPDLEGHGALLASKPASGSPAVQARVDAAIAHATLADWWPIAWIVLKSPFLGGFRNAIGWIILFFGLQQAWRLTRATQLRVSGPFGVDGSAPAA